MNYIKNFYNADSIINNISKNTDILLLGESTHGTEEFYKNRSDITKQLVSFDDFRDEGSPTQAHYYHRPKKTILVRTVKDGGESYHVSGDFDRTIPALYREIIKVLNNE